MLAPAWLSLSLSSAAFLLSSLLALRRAARLLSSASLATTELSRRTAAGTEADKSSSGEGTWPKARVASAIATAASAAATREAALSLRAVKTSACSSAIFSCKSSLRGVSSLRGESILRGGDGELGIGEGAR